MLKMILLLMAHLIASYMYIVLSSYKKPYEKLYRGIVVVFIPIFGMLLLILSDALEKFSRDQTLYDREGLMADRGKKEFLMRPDYEQSMNVVPLEEALILGDPYEKRKLLLNVLKKNMDVFIRHVKMALEDEDTETSHYAASTLMELSRKQQLTLQSMALEYEKNKEDIEFTLDYADSLIKYAQSGILEEKDKRKYLYEYSQIMEKALSTEGNEHISEERYGGYIEALMFLGLEHDAEKWCQRYRELYSSSEKPYICLLKHYYLTGQKKSFFELLKELKDTHIPISQETLSMIRFWSEERTSC